MSTVSTPMVSSAPLINKDRVIDWLGITPFIIFSLLFLIIPTLYLVVGAFLTPEGDFTLKNIGDLFTPSIMSAYWISITSRWRPLSAAALIGFFLAWAVVLGGLPASVRSTLLNFFRRRLEFRRACRSLSHSWQRSAAPAS